MNEIVNIGSNRSLEVISAEIRALTASMLTNIMEIGRRMCEAKELLPHGGFGDWIKNETGYSISTANNFMRIFKEYSNPQASLFGPEANCQTFGNLSYSKALALLQVPAEEREKFAIEHDAENVSTRELQDAIKEREEQRARADMAEADAKAAKEQLHMVESVRDEMGSLLHQSEDKYKRLKAEFEELKCRPVEVAVQQADPAEIENAVNKALAAAAKAHKKEMKAALDKANEAAAKSAQLEGALREAEQKAAEAVKNNGFAEAEIYKREAEELKKKLAMSDPAVAEFKGLFSQAVDIVGKLKELRDSASESGREGLSKALAALGRQIAEG